MDTYFSKTPTPEEKAMEDERNYLLSQIDNLEKEVRILRSNEQMLTDCIVRLAMKLVGVDG